MPGLNLFIILLLFIFSCTGEKYGTGDERIVVLTFDDAVRSHLTVVAPMLKKYNFPATFFVTHAFMDDSVNFLTWREIGELHKMGFEIGNHSWTHPDFSQPENAAGLAGELGLVNWQLMRQGVPEPVSFAWTGNGFGPEALRVLQEQGIRFARRGMQPEVPYGKLQPGPVYMPDQHHRLLIPTTRDAYPDMQLSDYIRAIEQAEDGRIVVLQFHGVPDPIHPWVHTEPEMLEKCFNYLQQNAYKVMALRDLESWLPDSDPVDPLVNKRHVLGDPDDLRWPQEVLSTREDRDFWIGIMKAFNYSIAEMAGVFGWPEKEMQEVIQSSSFSPVLPAPDQIMVLPYPGGRHPRISFREGMLSPMRGTKVGIFLPWDPQDYLLLDLPEAVFSQYGLTFLGHKHIPTFFDFRKIKIQNRDWVLHPDGHVTNSWELPNRMVIGAEIYPGREQVYMDLWMYNGTRDTTFTDMQTQICIMFRGAENFDSLTNENKLFQDPVAAVRSEDGERWILTAWEGCNHAWGNEDCPCMHSDPVLPDCAPGDTVRVSGKIWFSMNEKINLEMNNYKIKE
ncbi:MAG: polysaccharide deacetylase family protein [Cyclobacteriaceae bacterium]|nr:polysaccharide deacetylase family protein [Cyclobacteriaceae bacterium]